MLLSKIRLVTAALAVVMGVGAAPSVANAIAIAIGPGGQPASPINQLATAEAVLIGKVIEIEKDAVEVPAYKGAPKEQKITYKIAVIKIETPLIGTKGLTQIRVGFQDGGVVPGRPVELPGGGVKPLPAPLPGGGPGGRRPIRPGFGGIALAANQEGAFFLNNHFSGDFYVINQFNGVWNKKDEGFEKNVEAVKKLIKIYDEPLAALKDKDQAARQEATMALLMRYRSIRSQGTPKEVEIPAEESKLIVQNLIDMPYLPKDNDYTKPSRSQLFYQLNPNQFGYKNPQFQPAKPGEPQPDYNKITDESQVKFLKESGDKIKVKKFVVE